MASAVNAKAERHRALFVAVPIAEVSWIYLCAIKNLYRTSGIHTTTTKYEFLFDDETLLLLVPHHHHYIQLLLQFLQLIMAESAKVEVGLFPRKDPNSKEIPRICRVRTLVAALPFHIQTPRTQHAQRRRRRKLRCVLVSCVEHLVAQQAKLLRTCSNGGSRRLRATPHRIRYGP